MVDTLASNVSNAKGQKLDSSNQHSGSSSGTTLYTCNLQSLIAIELDEIINAAYVGLYFTDNVPVMNIVTDTGFQDGRSGTADQVCIFPVEHAMLHL